MTCDFKPGRFFFSLGIPNGVLANLVLKVEAGVTINNNFSLEIYEAATNLCSRQGGSSFRAPSGEDKQKPLNAINISAQSQRR